MSLSDTPSATNMDAAVVAHLLTCQMTAYKSLNGDDYLFVGEQWKEGWSNALTKCILKVGHQGIQFLNPRTGEVRQQFAMSQLHSWKITDTSAQLFFGSYADQPQLFYTKDGKALDTAIKSVITKIREKRWADPKATQPPAQMPKNSLPWAHSMAETDWETVSLPPSPSPDRTLQMVGSPTPSPESPRLVFQKPGKQTRGFDTLTRRAGSLDLSRMDSPKAAPATSTGGNGPSHFFALDKEPDTSKSSSLPNLHDSGAPHQPEAALIDDKSQRQHATRARPASSSTSSILASSSMEGFTFGSEASLAPAKTPLSPSNTRRSPHNSPRLLSDARKGGRFRSYSGSSSSMSLAELHSPSDKSIPEELAGDVDELLPFGLTSPSVKVKAPEL